MDWGQDNKYDGVDGPSVVRRRNQPRGWRAGRGMVPHDLRLNRPCTKSFLFDFRLFAPKDLTDFNSTSTCPRSVQDGQLPRCHCPPHAASCPRARPTPPLPTLSTLSDLRPLFDSLLRLFRRIPAHLFNCPYRSSPLPSGSVTSTTGNPSWRPLGKLKNGNPEPATRLARHRR
jgi:hypothetical protein